MARTKQSQSTTTVVLADGRVAKYVPNQIDRNRVRDLVLLGLPPEIIATHMGAEGIGLTTLHHHYGKELTKYRDEVLGKIASGAYRMALPVDEGGDPDTPIEIRSRMMMFVLKTRAGWRESDTTVINANNVQLIKRIVGVDDKDL